MGKYIHTLASSVPEVLYILLLVFAIAGGIFFYKASGTKEWSLKMSILLVVEYVILLCSSTVFFREASETWQYKLRPLWSYDNFELHSSEILMNIIVFIPLGFLIGFAFRRLGWWKIIFIGICVSVGIEFLQFVFKRGYSEIDDVIHNTMGRLLGYGLYYLTSFVLRKKMDSRKMNYHDTRIIKESI